MMQLDAKVLRALAGLARKPEDVGLNNPTTRLHLRPLPDLPPDKEHDELRPQGSVVEVCDGRAYVRVEVPETCDGPVLLDRDTARMPLADQVVSIDGTRLRVHGFEKVLEEPNVPGGVQYPGCDELRPDSAARVAFEISPAVLANVAGAVKKLGVRRVQVLLPVQRGGPIGIRGEMRNGRTVEATILSESLFGAVAEDVPADRPVAGHLPGPRALDAPDPSELPALPTPAIVLCGEPATWVWQAEDAEPIHCCDRHRDFGDQHGRRRSSYAALDATLWRTCQAEADADAGVADAAA